MINIFFTAQFNLNLSKNLYLINSFFLQNIKTATVDIIKGGKAKLDILQFIIKI